MINFRNERIVDGVTELTEVEVVFEDKDSASALHAKHRVVAVICEMLIPEGELTQSEFIKGDSVQTQSRPTPPGAE